jgi:MFS family permease
VHPVYAAGFVTAFGAHSIAANLGAYAQGEHASLWTLGALLAVYDGAEILLKPVFGALADRVGPRPVLVGGLLAFAVASAAFVLAGTPTWVGLARFGQGAAAAAFSPAANALVAQLAPPSGRGRAFGGYGGVKSLGYALGPVLGAALITLDGYQLLFTTLAFLALAVAVWASLAVPAAHPVPATRHTLLDTVRRLAQPGFWRPTATLAATTAALAVGVGFLPVLGAAHGLGALATGAAVSVLAATTTVTQPWAGTARDRGWITDRAGMALGLEIAAGGAALAATLPQLSGLVAAEVLIGLGVGIATPLAFAHLAAHAPPERLGSTMGSAEIGREAGDAGGPLLVGALANISTLGVGLLGLTALLAATATAVAARPRKTTTGD